MFFAETLVPKDPRCHVVQDESELAHWERVLNGCASTSLISWDTETSGHDWWGTDTRYREGPARIVAHCWGYDEGNGPRGLYMPIRHQTTDRNLKVDAVTALAKGVLGNPKHQVATQNGKYDLHFAEADGIEVLAFLHDTLIAGALLDENQPKDLESLAETYLGATDARVAKEKLKLVFREACKQRGCRQKDAPGYAWIPVPIAGVYGALDGVHTLGVAQKILPWVMNGWGELYATELRLLRILQGMERVGTPLDIPYLEQLNERLLGELEAIEAQVFQLAGYRFNIGSDEQVRELVYQRLGQPVLHWTEGNGWDDATKKPSVGSVALMEIIHRTGSPLVRLILDHREKAKIVSTYTLALAARCDPNGILHGTFKQVGTVTGRLCVAGDTILELDCGPVRIDQYRPTGEDRIRTHTGAWRRVLRRFKKGVEPMVRVVLSDGHSIKCTRGHRLLTPRGWCQAGRLSVGDEVISGCEPDSTQRSRDPGGGHVALPVERQADGGERGVGVGGQYADGARDSQIRTATGGVPTREGVAILTQQAGRKQPYAGEARLAASQLQGALSRQGRLCAGPSSVVVYRAEGIETRLRASCGVVRAAWVDRNSQAPRSPSHRRKQGEQRSKQPSFGDARRSQQAPRTVTVAAIEPVGAAQVWDIEVEGDHSYAAHGMIHHNSSSDPNLQNMPSSDEAGIRRAFTVPAGRIRLFMDFSQIELRVLAFLAREPSMMQAFINGEDVHSATSWRMFGNAAKGNRRISKVINFGVAYGMSQFGVRDNLNKNADPAKGVPTVDEKQAAAYLDQWHELFPRVRAHVRELVYGMGRHRPPAFTNLFGRTRRIPSVTALGSRGRRGERQAIASEIQGTAAELTKVSIVRAQQIIDEGRKNGLYEADLVGTIHDEIVVDVDRGGALALATHLKAAMEDFPQFHPIPIICDGEWTATNWAEKTSIWPEGT